MTSVLDRARSAVDTGAEPARQVLRHRGAGPLIKAAALLVVLWVVARTIFDAPASIVLDGVALGSLYGLIGAGVVLIYRTNRIINFAAAAVGAVPGVLAALLIVERGVSWYLAFPLVLVGGALLGGLTDFLIIRRFATAPRLILTVVTIGISQLLAFIAIYIPRWVGREQAGFISAIDTPFNDVSLRVGNRDFSGDYAFAVFAVAVLVFALAAFFRYTRIGIALRASAENADRASLLGIPVRRVGTVAWVIAGVFGAVTIFLRSTLVGVPVDGTLGPTVLLYALTAAVIARMESIPTCMVAGIGIGMLDQASVFKTARSSLAAAIMLVIILVALLLQRHQLSRAQDTGVSTWQSMREFRPVPLELRNVKEVVWARVGLFVVVAVLALLAPFIVGEARLGRLAPIPIYAIVAVSLVILTGWAGQISLGQFGIVGIGAAIAGGLAANHNIDFFLALFLGTVGGAFASVLIGLPALRIQGLYLAVTTLAFAGAVQGYVLDPTYPVGDALLPDAGNRIERPWLWERIDLTNDTEIFGVTLFGEAKYYYFCLAFLAVALLAARAYRRNRAGRVLIALRDNARAAPSYAINMARNRLAAFAISGAFAAAAGVLLAYQQGALDPSSYGIGPSVEIFTITVVGGLTALPGAVLGAVLIQGIKYYSTIDQLSLLVTGPGLILVLMFLPGGLAEGMYKVRDQYLRWVADRHGMLVPSLVADKRVQPEEAEESIVAAAEHHVEAVGSLIAVEAEEAEQ